MINPGYYISERDSRHAQTLAAIRKAAIIDVFQARKHQVSPELLALAADIISAHVSNNTVSSGSLPQLIRTVCTTLDGLGKEQITPIAREPAVPIKRSVFADHIICLEDGLKMKMLKRHLQQHHGLTPEQYRIRWDLPDDYPMVAPRHAEMRSTIAKQIGLGIKGNRSE